MTAWLSACDKTQTLLRYSSIHPALIYPSFYDMSDYKRISKVYMFHKNHNADYRDK